MKNYKISLIVCTLGNAEYIEKLLESLEIQSYKNYEVIVVDQNEDQKIYEKIKKYEKSFELKYLKHTKGLSVSRNYGLKFITGDIVGFPDDDCFYDKDALDKINEFFNKENYNMLSIRMKNSINNSRKIQENEKSRELTHYNLFQLVASISMFFLSNLFNENEKFDEELGLGSKGIFKSCEDYEIVARFLNKEKMGYYTNEILVYHPWGDQEIDQKKNLVERGFASGAAEMYFMNKIGYSTFFKLFRIFKRILIIIYYIFKANYMRVKFSYNILKGYLRYF